MRRWAGRQRWILGAGMGLGCLLGGALPVWADWRTEVGEDDLALFLAAAPPSDGAGIVVEQVEATSNGTNDYLPQDPTTATTVFTGTGEFAGKSFTQISGTGSKSAHAARVGGYFFGLGGSLASGVVTVGNQSAGGFIFLTLGTPYFNETNPVPELETPRQVALTQARVQSHAYVGTAANLEPDELADMSARFDYFVEASSVLAIVGLNNGSSSSPPPLWNSAYNALSVGLSSGAHSSGDTVSGFVGAGRVKPDLVAPMTATSWSTGAVASAATILHGTIDALGLDPLARRPEVLKAILLAGAAKTPFPDWNQSLQTLDSHFGAGELDLVATHRILAADRQPGLETPSAGLARRGWDGQTVTDAAPLIYPFTIPAEGLGAEFSAALCWHRTVQEIQSGNGPNATYTYAPDPLADLALELHDANGLVARSDSAVDNVEHLYQRFLPPGDYQLRVHAAPGAAAAFGLAWRAEIQLSPRVELTEEAGASVFALSALKANHRFWFQRSPDNQTWNTLETIEESTTTHHTTDPTPPATEPIPTFYRLQWFAP